MVSGNGQFTVTADEFARWDKVRTCEEGPGTPGWATDGPTYSGGLGWTHANWTQFNVYGFPADAANATPDEQVYVAVHGWEPTYGGPPDQNGCSGGY